MVTRAQSHARFSSSQAPTQWGPCETKSRALPGKQPEAGSLPNSRHHAELATQPAAIGSAGSLVVTSLPTTTKNARDSVVSFSAPDFFTFFFLYFSFRHNRFFDLRCITLLSPSWAAENSEQLYFCNELWRLQIVEIFGLFCRFLSGRVKLRIGDAHEIEALRLSEQQVAVESNLAGRRASTCNLTRRRLRVWQQCTQRRNSVTYGRSLRASSWEAGGREDLRFDRRASLRFKKKKTKIRWNDLKITTDRNSPFLFSLYPFFFFSNPKWKRKKEQLLFFNFRYQRLKSAIL